MILKSGIIGNGFDVNQSLSASQAAAFKAAGYDFCIRYIPRISSLVSGNISLVEINNILTSGLALGIVQHVASAGWQPTAALGTQYGEYAGNYCKGLLLTPGVNIWLDLEEVNKDSGAHDVIDYCTSWFDEVSNAGYVPGLYVGWGTNLSDEQLYNLPFKHYWRAYNCDQSIPTRGYQLIQKTQQTLNGITFDPNISQVDGEGDSAIFVSS